MPKKSAIVAAYERLPQLYDDASSLHEHRGGYVSTDELIAIITSGACKKVLVSAQFVGLVAIPKERMLQRFEDRYFKRDVERYLAQYPRSAWHISISPTRIESRRQRDQYGYLRSVPLMERGETLAFKVTINHFGYDRGDNIYYMRG